MPSTRLSPTASDVVAANSSRLGRGVTPRLGGLGRAEFGTDVTPGNRSTVHIVFEVLACAVLVGSVGVAAMGLLAGGPDRNALPVGGVLAVLIGAGLGSFSPRRVRPWVVPLVQLAGFVVMHATVRMSTGRGLWAALPGIVPGLRDGGVTMLSAALPVSARGPAFTLTLAVMWITGAVMAHLLTVRSGAVTLLFPPMVTLTLVLAAGASGPEVPQVVLLVGLVAALGFVVLRGLSSQWATGLVMVAIMGVAASVCTPFLPWTATRNRFDVQRLWQRQEQTPAAISELSRLPEFLAKGDEVQYSFASNDSGFRWRLATLDRFDGTAWQSTARFRRSATDLPQDPSPSPATSTVTAAVVPKALVGYLAPSPGRAVRVSVDGMDFDASSGNLAWPRGRQPEPYSIEAQVPRLQADQLRHARPLPHGADGVEYPPALKELAAGLAAPRETEFGKVAALQEYFLQSDFSQTSGAEAPVGHGFVQVDRLIMTRQGTAEQYASAFVLLARSLGYRSRVVVGFSGEPAGAGKLTDVRGRDVTAWPEVEFEGVGWVPFTAVPERRSEAVSQPTSRPTPPAATQVVDTAVGDDSSGQRGRDTTPLPPPPSSEPAQVRPSWTWPLVAGAASLLAVLAVLGLPLVKWVRRSRRRRAKQPHKRISGAWAEVLDRYRDWGYIAPDGATARQVAAAVRERFGPGQARPLDELTGVVDSAWFRPRDPAALTEAADRAWVIVDALLPLLRRGRPGAVRLLAWLHPATVFVPARTGVRPTRLRSGLRGLTARSTRGN